MTTSASTLVSRADLALADLASNGGLLLPEQANQFIDFIYDEPTMLKQARFIRMAGPQMKINRMGFGSRILRAARQTGSELDGGGNDRYVRAADRAKPTTTQIALSTSEVIAEVRIPYEVLEDNIEGESFEAHVLRAIATRVAIDLEELALWADTATVGDDFLALQNGWMKRANVHVLDNLDAGVSPDTFANALLQMPSKYLRNLPQMKAFISLANRIRYQQNVGKRQTGYGDAAIQQNIPLQAHGLTIEGAGMLDVHGTGDQGLVTMAQNLIWGIQREITIETDKDIRSREYIIVVTARVALQVDDTNAIVRLDNLGTIVAPTVQEMLIVNGLTNPVNTNEVA
jgi:hypothetical protein